jgi:hypothetical protein
MRLDTEDKPFTLLQIRLVNATSLIYLIALADTFGGLLQGIIPVALLLRSIMITFLLAYVISQPTRRPSIKLLWFALIGYFLIRVVINYLINLDERVLLVEGGATLKLIYFPLLYAYLLDQLDRGKIRRDQLYSILLVYGWLILASLAVGHVSGLGGVIKGRGTEMEGGKGFMIGANEVGLMLLLTAPFVGADMRTRMRSLFFGGMAQLLIYGIAGIFVFTKSSLIATMVSAYSVYRTFLGCGKRVRTLLWIGLVSLGIFIVVLILSLIHI